MHKSGTTFRQLVRLGDSPSDCWEWLGHVSPKTGYGKKQFQGRTMLAHRWVWQLFFGPIPRGSVVNHRCRNRSCVNPHHLEITSQTANVRHGLGTVLTADQVKEIKASFSSRRWGTGTKLAREYGVSPGLIHDIWRGRAWADINP